MLEGSALDRNDGFIHFSTADQLAETARRHFCGQEDLVVLTVQAERLGAALIWEPSRDGHLFPHLYGVLNLSDVQEVMEAPRGMGGSPGMDARRG